MYNFTYFFSAANAASYHDPKSMPEVKPEVKKPEFVISGGPSIKQCEILNDKRHILTKDTENNVSLYDVLKARKVEDLGQVEFEQEVKKRLQVSIKGPLIKFMFSQKATKNHEIFTINLTLT